MTITDATHALAVQSRRKARLDAVSRRVTGGVRFVDLAARVEPSWVEAVAVVQAVCAQLQPGQAAPAIDAIRVSTSGEVSFAAVASADEVTAVRGVGRLLTEILPTGDCPLSVIEASERASRAPTALISARAFGDALTCLPHAHGPRELAQYVRAAEAAARPAMPAAASETFSTRNINQSIDESLQRYTEVIGRALAAGLRVRGYVSCAFGCPFEGPVTPAAVLRVTRALLDAGVYEVAVSDTIGIGHPGQVRELLAFLGGELPFDRLALHFHDTRGTALANVLAALDAGITTFDAAAGGLGGCPFAPGASGNLATEDLLYMLDGLGVETGVSLAGVAAASDMLAARLDHPLRSRYLQAERASHARIARGIS